MTSSSNSLPTPPEPPTTLRVECPHCARAFGIRPAMLGNTVACPNCEQPVDLPMETAPKQEIVQPKPSIPTPPPVAPPIASPGTSPPTPTLSRDSDTSAKLAARPSTGATPPSSTPSRNDSATDESAAAPIDQANVSSELEAQANKPTAAKAKPDQARKDKSTRRGKGSRRKPEQNSSDRRKSQMRRDSISQQESGTRQDVLTTRPQVPSDEMPLLPPGAAETSPTIERATDDLLPPSAQFEDAEKAVETAPAADLESKPAADSIPAQYGPSEVRLPDGEGGFVIASSRVVRVQDGEREIKLERLDRKERNQRRSMTSLIVFGVCIATLVVSIVLLRMLFGGGGS